MKISLMMRWTCAAVLAAGSITCFAADSPWSGTWKLNEAKSKMTGGVDVVTRSPDGRWTVSTSGMSFHFACDGKEYPVMGTQKLICSLTGDKEANFIIKSGGDEIARVKRTLSDGDRTMTVVDTGKTADGTPFHDTEVYKKTSGDKGWAGTWQNTKVAMSTHGVVVVQAPGDSITFMYPMSKSSLTAKLDGTPASAESPHPDGVMVSLKADGPTTIHEVDTMNGAEIEHDTLSVSADGKTMTIEAQRTNTPDKQVYVYEKQ